MPYIGSHLIKSAKKVTITSLNETLDFAEHKSIESKDRNNFRRYVKGDEYISESRYEDDIPQSFTTNFCNFSNRLQK